MLSTSGILTAIITLQVDQRSFTDESFSDLQMRCQCDSFSGNILAFLFRFHFQHVARKKKMKSEIERNARTKRRLKIIHYLREPPAEPAQILHYLREPPAGTTI